MLHSHTSVQHPPKRRDTVAVIGGGLTGAAVAYHLARHGYLGRIIVVEPRPALGAGVAYGTEDHAHRVNVPASRMSLLPREDQHFQLWIKRTNAVADDPAARAADGHLYPRRSVFGRYVQCQLAPFLERKAIEHVQASAMRIERDDIGSNSVAWRINTSNGKELSADIVVLATTHPPPDVPAPIAATLTGDARLISDPTRPDALLSIERNARVLIVGTGLTMADIVASLDLNGHQGEITALSRRGLLPREHAPGPTVPYGYFVDVADTALGFLRHVRATIARGAASNEPWQSVIDAVRYQAQTFWPALPLAERRRIVRHLRAFWDVHRFRIAPQISEVLKRRQGHGSFRVLAGRIHRVEPTSDAIVVTYVPRHGHAPQRASFDNVIVATGPAHGRMIEHTPHLKSLGDAGLITADSLGLGITTDTSGRAVGATGEPVADLFIAGPLARATWGELMGLPQVTEHAAKIACELMNAASDNHISLEGKCA